MSLINRYVRQTVWRGYALVLSILVAFFGLLALLEQLEDVGDANYGTVDALLYVALTTPARVLEVAPVTALLGGLVAIGSLARHSELLAIRAAGISPLHVGWVFVKPAAIFLCVLMVIAEFVAPPLRQAAERGRAIEVSDIGDVLRGRGLWSRDGLRFLNVRRLLHGRYPAGIELYEFTEGGQLDRYLYAEWADVLPDGGWQLREVQIKQADGLILHSRRVSHLQWRPFWTRKQLNVVQLPASSLSLSELRRYIRYLDTTDQASDKVNLLFWQRLTGLLSVPAMALLAVPFGFGGVRSASFTKLLAIGALIGLLFHIVVKVGANLGLLLELSAPASTLPPALLAATVGLLLLGRVR